MAEPKVRTTIESVLAAIMRNQEGPVVLWHYSCTTEERHLKYRALLHGNLRDRYRGGAYNLAGAYWKLQCKGAGDNAGGFALLVRQPDGWTPEQAKPAARNSTSRAKDPKAWWMEQLLKRGIQPRTNDGTLRTPNGNKGYNAQVEYDKEDGDGG